MLATAFRLLPPDNSEYESGSCAPQQMVAAKMSKWVISDIFADMARCPLLTRKRPEKLTWQSLMAEQSRTPRARPILWLFSGGKRTWNDHRNSVVCDPKRHFCVFN
jgi:hypothetical protein